MRIVAFVDHEGKQYLGLDRVVGVICTDPIVIHSGLRGFLGPEIVPPTVQAVAHRQVLSKARQRRKGRRVE